MVFGRLIWKIEVKKGILLTHGIESLSFVVYLGMLVVQRRGAPGCRGGWVWNAA